MATIQSYHHFAVTTKMPVHRRDYCGNCPDTYPHYEHQTCAGCQLTIPKPTYMGSIIRSDVCDKCWEIYDQDENGNLVKKVQDENPVPGLPEHI